MLIYAEDADKTQCSISLPPSLKDEYIATFGVKPPTIKLVKAWVPNS